MACCTGWEINPPEVPAKLRLYETWIEQLLAAAKGHYAEVRLYVFSDHGMANCDELLDLKAKIEALDLRMEKDYAVVYDSTMARFWFFNDRARQLITEALGQVPQGRILPDAELAEMRTLFPDRYFGELIFLVKEGVLIVPSHMGERPIRGDARLSSHGQAELRGVDDEPDGDSGGDCGNTGYVPLDDARCGIGESKKSCSRRPRCNGAFKFVY